MRFLPPWPLLFGLVACTSAAGDSAGTARPAATPGELVPIGASFFEMGCDPAVHPECDGDEAPVHTVQLSAFAIEATEVTVDQWRACVAAYACPDLREASGPADLPITGVGVDTAEQYCAWRHRRLPTEAQWERAARGPDGGLYPWGDEAPDCDRVASRACDGGLRPVATHPAGASPEGVLDMAGNAWEWVTDGYDPMFYGEPQDPDPIASVPGGLRIVRGVDGWSDPAILRATNREMAIGDAVSQLVGFRCVEEL